MLKGTWLCLCYQEQQLPSQAQSGRTANSRACSFNTLSVGTPAFLSKLLPILPSPIPEQLPDVWQCLNFLPLSKHGPAAVPDALMPVSALGDEGSPGREEQPAGFWREGLLVLQGAEGWRGPLPAARLQPAGEWQTQQRPAHPGHQALQVPCSPAPSLLPLAAGAHCALLWVCNADKTCFGFSFGPLFHWISWFIWKGLKCLESLDKFSPSLRLFYHLFFQVQESSCSSTAPPLPLGLLVGQLCFAQLSLHSWLPLASFCPGCKVHLCCSLALLWCSSPAVLWLSETGFVFLSILNITGWGLLG